MGLFNIFYDSDGLEDAKAQYESLVSDLKDAAIQLNTLIIEMEQTWTGDAAIEYINRLKQQLNELCQLEGISDALAQTANERANDTQQVDNRFGSFIGALVNTIVSGFQRLLSVFGFRFN